MSAIVGKKLGMTRVFDEDGTAIPVTVVEAAPNKITGDPQAPTATATTRSSSPATRPTSAS